MKNELNEIRRLLDLYYEGQTTPEEERTLLRFFADAGDLPADLEPDRELFAALVDETADDCPVPTTLHDDIMRRLDSLPGAQPGRRTPARVLWLRIASAAAAIALIATVAVHFTNRDTTDIDTKQLALAEESTTDTQAVVLPDAPAEEVPAVLIEEPERPAAAAATSPKPLKPSKAVRRKAAPAQAQPYREYIDSDEAVAEAQKAMAKLKASLQPMHHACADVKEKLQQVDNKLNEILK